MVRERYSITEQAVLKWCKHDIDCSQTAHRTQTTLAPVQGAIAVSLLKTLRFPVKDAVRALKERSWVCLLGSRYIILATWPKPKWSIFLIYCDA
jgi:hypothetical protein